MQARAGEGEHAEEGLEPHNEAAWDSYIHGCSYEHEWKQHNVLERLSKSGGIRANDAVGLQQLLLLASRTIIKK